MYIYGKSVLVFTITYLSECPSLGVGISPVWLTDSHFISEVFTENGGENMQYRQRQRDRG